MLIDSKYAPDIDGDGASDLFETLSGTDRVLTDGTLTASAPVKVRCEFTPNTSGTYEITLRTSTPELVTGVSCTDLADGGRMFLPDDVTAGDGGNGADEDRLGVHDELRTGIRVRRRSKGG